MSACLVGESMDERNLAKNVTMVENVFSFTEQPAAHRMPEAKNSRVMSAMGYFHPRDEQGLSSPIHHHFPSQSAQSGHFLQRIVFYGNFQLS